MKQIIIIAEGQTEQEFCKEVLAPHFGTLGIGIYYPTTKIGGGIVNWPALKRQIDNHLKGYSNWIVTTLIDYYGIYAHHQFPNWEEAHKKALNRDKVSLIEEGMKDDIITENNNLFVPYIQLHEFEALLFCDGAVFENLFDSTEIEDKKYLEQTLLIPPEDINNDPNTAPSKRIKRIIPAYDKVVYGPELLKEIGLDKIRRKCPRFNEWISELEKHSR